MRRALTLILITFVLSGCGIKSVFHREPPPVESEVVREADWKMDFEDVYFLDARNGWIVSAAGTIIHTSDGGKNWELILSISRNTGVSDIAFDPRDPDLIYATSYQRRRHVWTLVAGGPESAIYKSLDGGRTWKKIVKGLPSADLGRIGITVSPQKPDVIYAIVAAAWDESGFFRSDDPLGILSFS